jgi:hypothetical protein
VEIIHSPALLSPALQSAHQARYLQHPHHCFGESSESGYHHPMQSERPHPQRVELEQRIGWFIANPQFELCVVVEPVSQSIIRLAIPHDSKRGFRSPKLGRIMQVELTPDEAVREEVLLKIGFESAGRRKGNWQGERNCIFPHYTKLAMHGRRASQDVLRVMQDVFLLGDCAWLWTFHVDDPDQWPDPLPRPDPWPPLGSELV